MIYTWKVHGFGYGPSTAIFRWYFFILFPNFSISFQATHPVLPIQLPPSTWSFAIAVFQPTIQIVATWHLSYRKHKPELKYRNNQATGKPRNCCSTAKDEIKCQSNAEGYASRFFMSPMFKNLCDPLLPTFNWKHSICNKKRRKRCAEIQSIKRSFYKNAICSGSHCLNLIFKKQWVYMTASASGALSGEQGIYVLSSLVCMMLILI